MEDRNKLAAAVFNRRAINYQERFMDVSAYRAALDLFCDRLYPETGAAILDIACGPGNMSRYILDQKPGVRLLGLDLAPAMIELAKRNNPEARFLLMDAREISTLPGPYDGIIAGFICPYLSREETVQLIAAAAALLSAKGVLYLSTMEGAAVRSGWQESSYGDQVYLYYHEGELLLEALETAGLHLLQLFRQPYTGHDGREETDLIILAGK